MFYKGEEYGITIVENEECHTSKCDAYALEDVGFRETYCGKRKYRGLFISQDGTKINGDVNGAINIMRKYVKKVYPQVTETLNSIIKATKSSICYPRKYKSMQTFAGCCAY